MFGIIGGDRRYAELARLLEQDGHTVRTCRITGEGIAAAVSEASDALEQALAAETVILPLCREGGTLDCAGKPLAMADLLALLAQSSKDTPGRLVLAGMVPEELRREAERRGVRLVDYFRLETLSVANAAATADAALCLTVQHTRETLTGKRCLVLGFGRIGKLLCLRLRGLGTSVAAAARKSTDRAWVCATGCEAIDFHALSRRLGVGHPGGFDVVYNTVPAPVLDRAALETLAEHSDRPLLVELASCPGFDREDAERLGLRVLPANGLPGKIVPVTAAAALRDAVYEILTEDSAARGSKTVFDSERNVSDSGK